MIARLRVCMVGLDATVYVHQCMIWIESPKARLIHVEGCNKYLSTTRLGGRMYAAQVRPVCGTLGTTYLSRTSIDCVVMSIKGV